MAASLSGNDLLLRSRWKVSLWSAHLIMATLPFLGGMSATNGQVHEELNTESWDTPRAGIVSGSWLRLRGEKATNWVVFLENSAVAASR